MSDSAGFSPEGLAAAVRLISRSLDGAGLETLEGAHAILEKHFLVVIAAGSTDNFSEQRVLGVLWAEIEVEIDKRREKLQAGGDGE